MPLLRSLLVLSFLFISGCPLTVPFDQALPEENLLVHLDDAELFAVRPDGEMVAYVADGLHILRLNDNYQQQLTYDNPNALIWTPDGSALVAAFRETEKTRLVRLGASAEDRPQIFVAEQITDFAWLADGRLLAMAQQVDEEMDSLQIEASLLIWDGQWDVERIPLYSQSFYVSNEFRLPVMHQFDLSPLKDELIYNRYIDPSIPGGYVEMVHYNILSSRDFLLAETDNRQSEAFFGADGETVLLPGGRGEVLLLNPWTDSSRYQWPALGESLQIAPQRDLFFVDGKLYVNDRLELSLPAPARVRFSSDGERMFAAWQRKLYLFSGYPVPDKIEFSKVEKVKLQRIRQQRSRDEISIRDYYQQRNNILNL